MADIKMSNEELLEVITNLDDAKKAVDVLYRCNNALNNLQALTKGLADLYRIQRDEARQAARFFRDLYVSQVGRTYPEEYTLPWEAEK